MKHFLYTAVLFAGMLTQGFASVSLIMPHLSGTNGTQITVPVKVKDFQDIISMQGTVQWNPAIVTYSSVQQYGLPGMNASNFGTTQVGSGKLTFSWFEGNFIGQNLPDSAVVFSISFNIIGTNGQSSALSFINVPTILEIINSTFAPETVVPVNGSISVQSMGNPVEITFYMDTVSGLQGTQVGLSVRAVDFVNINSIQGTLQFNTAVATYAGISYFGLPGMTMGNFGTTLVGSGKLTYSWNDMNLTGIDMPDSSALFTVLFNLAGSPGTQTIVEFATAPTPFEVSDSLYNVLNADKFAGLLSIDNAPVTTGIHVHCDTASGNYGSQVMISMFAQHFSDIISMQGTLQFDTAVAVFDTVVFYGLPDMTIANFGLSQTTAGKLMYSWNDPTLVGVSVLPVSPLFTMQFTLVGMQGSSTPVAFIDVPTPQEYVNSSFTTLTDTLVPGLITVTGTNSITTNDPSPLVYCEGGSISVQFGITGVYNAGNLFILQISDAAGSFASPVNLDTIAGTVPGTFTCNLPAGLPAGSGYRLRVNATNPPTTGAPNPSSITINNIPSVPSPISGPDTVCSGSQVIFSVPFEPGLTYSWTVPGTWTLLSGQGTQLINVMAGTGSGNICVTATNGLCSSAQNCEAVLVMMSPATPGPISGDVNVCAGSVNTYSISPVSGATHYAWTLPTGWTGSSTTETIIALAGNTGGTITVTARTQYCASAAQSLVVTVHDPAAPVITITLDMLSSSYPGGNQWFFNGDTIPGANGPDYQVTQNGQYFVIYTDAYGCWVSSDTIDFVWVNAGGIHSADAAEIFPNPSDGPFFLSWPGDGSTDVMVSVTSSLGSVVFQQMAKTETKQRLLRIDPGTLPAGFYIVAVTSSRKQYRAILVIQ